MKRVALLVALVLLSGSAFADKYVSGYTKRDGTYVQGHYKSDVDSNRYNNRSSQTMGGTKRDEYSTGGGATNKSNSAYGMYDNDRDGVNNTSDRKPEKKNDCSSWNGDC